MHQDPGNDVSDIRVEAYRAVRAHEIILSEATAKFEQAALAPLIVLNGGAVIAFLTLLGALLGKDSGRRPQLVLSAIAIATWGIGLVAAALAIRYASRRESSISAAQRIMREGVEDILYPIEFAKILEGPVPDRDVGASLFSEPKKKRQADRIQIRRTERRKAEVNAKRLEKARLLSVVMFVLGAALALSAVLAGGNVSNTKATSTSSAAAPVTTTVTIAGPVSQARLAA
jgi:hypothetical protein